MDSIQRRIIKATRTIGDVLYNSNYAGKITEFERGYLTGFSDAENLTFEDVETEEAFCCIENDVVRDKARAQLQERLDAPEDEEQ
jgi:hypothetical protein